MKCKHGTPAELQSDIDALRFYGVNPDCIHCETRHLVLIEGVWGARFVAPETTARPVGHEEMEPVGKAINAIQDELRALTEDLTPLYGTSSYETNAGRMDQARNSAHRIQEHARTLEAGITALMGSAL